LYAERVRNYERAQHGQLARLRRIEPPHDSRQDGRSPNYLHGST